MGTVFSDNDDFVLKSKKDTQWCRSAAIQWLGPNADVEDIKRLAETIDRHASQTLKDSFYEFAEKWHYEGTRVECPPNCPLCACIMDYRKEKE